MASISRLGAMARVPFQIPRRGVQSHFLNTSAILRSEATSNLGTVAGQKKPIGGSAEGSWSFGVLVIALLLDNALPELLDFCSGSLWLRRSQHIIC